MYVILFSRPLCLQWLDTGHVQLSKVKSKTPIISGLLPEPGAFLFIRF